MDLQPRVKRMLTQPRAEWAVIEPEPTDIPALYKTYIAPLAAIEPVAALVGMLVIGTSLPFAGRVRWGIGYGLQATIVQYIGMLLATFLTAVIFAELAPTFGSRKDRRQALKLVAYSSTAMWIAGIVRLLPFLHVLVVVAALYSLYTLYLGLPVMMKTPPDRVIPYLAVAILVALVANILLFFVLHLVAGVGTYRWF